MNGASQSHVHRRAEIRRIERRELDMLLSVGERISMALLSIAIRELGGDAISFTGSQSGIITNDRHIDARIIEVRPFRVQDELARERVVVIAGYQGVSCAREVTTLGRGGSDTTAVALAAALGAEWCEICSDVAGGASERDILVLQAAGEVERLLALLDSRGVVGKQLHASSVGAPGDGVALVISRENLHNEDQIRRDIAAAFGAGARIIYTLGAVSVVGAGINATYANVRRGTTALRESGIAAEAIATSSFRITWLVPRADLDDAVRTLHRTFL